MQYKEEIINIIQTPRVLELRVNGAWCYFYSILLPSICHIQCWWCTKELGGLLNDGKGWKWKVRYLRSPRRSSTHNHFLTKPWKLGIGLVLLIKTFLGYFSIFFLILIIYGELLMHSSIVCSGYICSHKGFLTVDVFS